MTGHILKRSKGSWTVVVPLDRDPVTGKRRQLWRTVVGSKKDAQRLLTDLLHQRDTGIDAPPGRMTVGDFLKFWLDRYAAVNVEPATLLQYRWAVRQHLTPALGGVLLTKLRPAMIQSFYAEAVSRGRADGRGGLSGKTVGHIHRLLREALDHAVKWQMLTRNPADAVTDVETNQDFTASDGPAIVQVTLSLSVVSATVVQGDTVLVTVNITDVDQFDAANYAVAFDPNVLSFVSAADGTIGATTIPVVATTVVTGTAEDNSPSDPPTGFADEDAVSVVTVVQNVDGTVGVSGSGTLAVLNFTFIGNSGESTVITLVGETAGPVLIDTDASGSGDALVNPVTLSDTAAITISPNLSNTAVSPLFLLGDANGDGDILPTDITAIELAVAAGLVVYGNTPGVTGEATPGADANDDGAINALDITEVELLTLNP